MAAFVGIIGLVGFVIFIAGLVATVKGSIRFLRIGSRKLGVLVMAGAVTLLAVGGALSPKPKTKQVATTVPSPTANPSPATPSSPVASSGGPAGTASPSRVAESPIEAPPKLITPTTLRPSTPAPVAPKPAPVVTTPAAVPTILAPVQTTASAPTPAGASCAATMANPTPGDGGTDAVQVSSNVPNAPIAVTLHYKTTTSHDSGTTDGSGAGTVPFGLGRPTIGYTVDVSVSVGGQAACSTSFTPQ